MADDSPVFSLVILAKQKWDKLINSNDLIRIKAIPDRTKGVPDNPYIMVGLISDIHKEGEYADGSLMYRITGQAMTKALIDFEVGVIQEVSAIIPSVGWLPDGTENGLHFSGNTAAGIGNELMDRFIYKFAKYHFAGGKGLQDYFTHSFSSWDKDESLSDVSPFINYEGSMRQFLEDIAAKPFNELFFEYTSDGTCVALMRPTPFDPDAWMQLPTYKFTSDIVVEESFGKNDSEMYSVFVVQAPNLMEFSSMDLGVYPKYHPSLIEKYGYKKLEAENRYLLSSGIAAANKADATKTNVTVSMPSYQELTTFLNENGYLNAEKLRKQRSAIYEQLVSQFPAMTKTLANNILDAIKDGDFNSAAYDKFLKTTGKTGKDQTINREKNVATEKLEVYTQRLFNWYCENANFYSGEIRVLGNPAYRVGTKVLYEDLEQDTTWEFYVESVQHEFSFTNGYTTILGVTRGLPDNGIERFSNLWGKSQNFKGGYLGELSIDDMLKSAANASKDSGEASNGSWPNSNGGTTAMNAMETANSMDPKPSKYVFGGGRTGSNPFHSSPIKTDCSSFVWWCYYENGVSLKGGKTGMNTDTIASDPQLTRVSKRGSSKNAAKDKLRKGDLVFFDTYKGDGHIGIYTGGGNFISSQDKYGIKESPMDKGYWWDHFNGHIMRYED